MKRTAETAAALADKLYGGERNMITVNMSEFQEAHSVSGLKGAPPGYVGYGRGGVLTEAVRGENLDRSTRLHEAVLEIDNDMSGARSGNHSESARPSSTPGIRRGDFGCHFRLEHGQVFSVVEHIAP